MATALGLRETGSVARFLLMPERQDINGIELRFVTIQGRVAGVSKTDQKLAPLEALAKRPADFGRCFQKQEMPFDRFASTTCSDRISVGQKPSAALQSQHRSLGDDYSWHSGMAFSSFVPQVLSQALASSPLRCRPVS